MAVPQRSIEDVLVAPVQLGRYVLLDAIEQSRIGTVHRACLRRAGKPDTLYAIKRLSAELSRDRRVVARFAEVMAHAAQLDHPAHCAIEDVDRAPDGSPFAALELVSGKDLGRVAAALVERGASMPPTLVAYVGSQIADALSAAHAMTRSGASAPLYHGELAPANILIGYDGRVRLTGLGTAELRALLPKSAARAGYQSPELRLGAACSARSDVFSLGACLYELLSGNRAVPGDPRSSASGTLRRADSHITQVIPRALEQVVSRALAEQPQARWQDAAEMARALNRWCAAQSRPGDAHALAAWMLDLFGADSKDEAARLQTWLARIPAASAQAQVVPASPSPPERLEADKSRSGPLPARPQAGEPWTDPSERTPPRGILMRKLAAEMVEAEPAAEEVYDEPWDLETPENPWAFTSEQQALSPSASGVALRPGAAPAAPPRGVSTPARSVPSLPPPTQLPPTSWSGRAPRPRWLVPAIAAAALGLLGAALLLLGRSGSQLSAIHVQSNPTGVEVFVRGARVGITPLRRDGVQSGVASFEFRAPGFETQTRAIELTPGEVAHLQVDLIARAAPPVSGTSAPAPQPSESPVNDREPEYAAPTSTARTRDDSNADRGHSHQHHSAHERDEAGTEPPAEATLVVQPAVVSTTASSGSLSTAPPTPLPSTESARLWAQPPAASPGAAAASEAGSARSTPTPAPSPLATVSASTERGPAPSGIHGVTREPVLIEQISPKVPARAKRLGVTTGVVSIEYTIDRSGAVANAAVVQADPPGVFEEAALRAIRSWRYHPKLYNGTPVESRQRFRFRFSE